jgi:hypothetical protein
MFHAGLLSLTAMSYAPHPFCIISRQKSMKALLLISFGMDISTFYKNLLHIQIHSKELTTKSAAFSPLD